MTLSLVNFWDLQVVVGDEDLTQWLVGAVTINTAENSAASAEFSVLAALGVVDIAAFVGKAVKIAYKPPGSNTFYRRFTGVIDTPEHDTGTGVTRMVCTDALQNRFDQIAGDTARAVADAKAALLRAENNRNKVAIDIRNNPYYTQAKVNHLLFDAEALVTAAKVSLANAETQTATRIMGVVGGLWSRMLFTPAASGWDTFTDLMSTQAASFALDSNGNGVTTSWDVKPTPDFVFTENDYLSDEDGDPYPKIDSLANSRDIVNSVDILFEYRFIRLFEYTFSLSWAPGPMFVYYATAAGYPVPDHAAIANALSGSGFAIRTANGAYGKTPLNTGIYGLRLYPIPAPGPVILDYNPNNLNNATYYLADYPRFSAVGGAAIGALKRYRQTVSETHYVSVTAPTSISQIGRINKVNEHAAESAVFTDAVLENIVGGWEDTRTETVTYQVSDNGVSVQAPYIARGGVTDSIQVTTQISANVFVWDAPSRTADNAGNVVPIAPDNNVACSLRDASLQNWDMVQSPIDGRAEFDNAFAAAKAVAVHDILESHRGNVVSFTVEAHPALELSHTVEVTRTSPVFAAKGKVSALSHSFDIESGAATTKVSLALIKTWATGASYHDPYIPPLLAQTIIYPGSQYTSALGDWPTDPRMLGRIGVLTNASKVPPNALTFRGFNWFTGDFVIESPPTPQEAVQSLLSLVPSSMTVEIPNDTLLVEA